jgi:hypothetical protein
MTRQEIYYTAHPIGERFVAWFPASLEQLTMASASRDHIQASLLDTPTRTTLISQMNGSPLPEVSSSSTAVRWPGSGDDKIASRRRRQKLSMLLQMKLANQTFGFGASYRTSRRTAAGPSSLCAKIKARFSWSKTPSPETENEAQSGPLSLHSHPREGRSNQNGVHHIRESIGWHIH